MEAVPAAVGPATPAPAAAVVVLSAGNYSATGAVYGAVQRKAKAKAAAAARAKKKKDKPRKVFDPYEQPHWASEWTATKVRTPRTAPAAARTTVASADPPGTQRACGCGCGADGVAARGRGSGRRGSRLHPQHRIGTRSTSAVCAWMPGLTPRTTTPIRSSGYTAGMWASARCTQRCCWFPGACDGWSRKCAPAEDEIYM